MFKNVNETLPLKKTSNCKNYTLVVHQQVIPFWMVFQILFTYPVLNSLILLGEITL